MRNKMEDLVTRGKAKHATKNNVYCNKKLLIGLLPES